MDALFEMFKSEPTIAFLVVALFANYWQWRNHNAFVTSVLESGRTAHKRMTSVGDVSTIGTVSAAMKLVGASPTETSKKTSRNNKKTEALRLLKEISEG